MFFRVTFLVNPLVKRFFIAVEIWRGFTFKKVLRFLDIDLNKGERYFFKKIKPDRFL